MSKRGMLLIEAGMVIASLCLFLWWPYAIDLFVWHCQPPVKGVCWIISNIYLLVVCETPIRVDGTRLTDLF